MFLKDYLLPGVRVQHHRHDELLPDVGVCGAAACRHLRGALPHHGHHHPRGRHARYNFTPIFYLIYYITFTHFFVLV